MVKPEKLYYRKPHFAMRATCVGIHSNVLKEITFRLERRPLDLHWRSNFSRDLGANSGAIERCWINDTITRLTRISYNFGYFCGINWRIIVGNQSKNAGESLKIINKKWSQCHLTYPLPLSEYCFLLIRGVSHKITLSPTTIQFLAVALIFSIPMRKEKWLS